MECEGADALLCADDVAAGVDDRFAEVADLRLLLGEEFA
jgi:hypothetical protein